MLLATTITTEKEMRQLLALQQKYLVSNVTKDEMKSEGFLTVHHTLPLLQQLHSLAPSIIIKENDEVIAYALVMLRECSQLVPELVPMFDAFDELHWQGKPLSDYAFYVMGQICVAKEYRGQGLFDMLYQKHRDVYGQEYDFIITEVATRNTRSMRAHERIGFKTIHTYQDKLDHWAVVIWDWKDQ